MSGDNSSNREGLPYRRGVGAMLLNPAGKVFVGRRFGNAYPNAWQMPQGGIDEGETPEQAVMRELEEETGTAKADIIAETKAWLSYDLPEDIAGVSWSGKYRGQMQKWFGLRFTGTDTDIDLNADEKPEFCEWRWATMEELPGLIVPFKRHLYDALIDEFHDLPERVLST
jgi:putative (di)nucleoside polyphosphate hydrolase